MKFNKHLLKEKWFSYTIALCSAVVLYLVLTHIGGIARIVSALWKTGAPVFMAFVIAYVLGPLAKVFSDHVFYKVGKPKLRHSLSVLFAILSVILFIVILAVALVPQVIESMVTFAGNLNTYVLSFQRLMQQLNSFALQHDIDLSQFISSSDELLQSITQILPENLNKIVNFSYSFGAKMFDWIISFIIAIYLMLDSGNLKAGFARLLHALLPANVYKNTATLWSRCNKILLQYIVFDLLDGLIIGLCNWFFMVVMNLPYVAIISVVVGVTNLAPTFGPMVGAIIGAFILVLVKPWYALLFLLFTLILQTLDGYVIKPRLFGDQLGVSSVWILISLVIGGRLLGVVGILLAIPFAAIVDFIYHDYIINWLEEQNVDHKKLKAAARAGQAAAISPVAEAVSDAAAAAAAEVQKAADIAAEEIEKAADAAAVEIEKAADAVAVELETAGKANAVTDSRQPSAANAEDATNAADTADAVDTVNADSGSENEPVPETENAAEAEKLAEAETDAEDVTAAAAEASSGDGEKTSDVEESI